ATGGHAAIVWLIGLGWACRTLAVTDAATPNARTARTAQRTRRRRTGVTDATPPGSPDGPRPAAPAGAELRTGCSPGRARTAAARHQRRAAGAAMPQGQSPSGAPVSSWGVVSGCGATVTSAARSGTVRHSGQFPDS